MRESCQYEGQDVFDIDGQPVYIGSLLRFRHPKMGLKYSNFLYPVYLFKEPGYCLTFDDFVVTTEHLKKFNLYVYSHVDDYAGDLQIVDDSHILSIIKPK